MSKDTTCQQTLRLGSHVWLSVARCSSVRLDAARCGLVRLSAAQFGLIWASWAQSYLVDIVDALYANS